MPPKQVKVDPDKVYRSETPLQQKRFPSRRRSVRPSRASAPPIRQQSTLTQIKDWDLCRTSPTSEHDDEDYDEDELERARPKRKKRKSEEDGKRQTTMTQFASSSAADRAQIDRAADDLLRNLQGVSFDGVRDSQAPSTSDGAHEEGLEQDDHMSTAQDVTTFQEPNDGEDIQKDDTDHRMLSEGEEDERVDSAFSKPQARPHPSPELPVSVMNLRTPRKRFKSEIPSSNTPQSAIVSICSTKSMRSPERSPLRLKGVNVWSQQPSPDKAPMSPVPDSPVKPISPFYVSPVKARQPVFRVPDKPPALQHRSTIPDSEDTATQLTPLKKPKFRSQIPDTQFDMFGEELAPITETQFPPNAEMQFPLVTETQFPHMETQHPHTETQFPRMETQYPSYTQYGGETYYAENDDYQSFDPVCSALDRDAARFMQTQRLQNQPNREFPDNMQLSQPKEHEEPVRAMVQQSQELGEDFPEPNSHRHHPDPEDDDPPTQSPRSSPRPIRLPYVSDEIEELDMTGDVIISKRSALEVIRIASSPSSKSVSSGKYPSSPPLLPENDLPPRTKPAKETNSSHRHSSPPPALHLPIPPSQVSTVGGTQLFPFTGRQNKWLASSSPPPLPPSTSSPPPEARHHIRKLLQVSDSEDEDEDDTIMPLRDDEEDHDMDLDVVPQRRRNGESEANNDGNGQESAHVRDGLRLSDILPDTLFDFSLPPPPTQSSVRSTRL